MYRQQEDLESVCLLINTEREPYVKAEQSVYLQGTTHQLEKNTTTTANPTIHLQPKTSKQMANLSFHFHSQDAAILLFLLN